MKSIILIAPPAAGKGTEAAQITADYNIPSISTGDLLRGARNGNDEKAAIIRKIQDEGGLVPDEIVLELLKTRISQTDCENGYILDGFPRNVSQAEAYDQILTEMNRDTGIVIVLDIDKEIAKSRISGRFTCPTCKRIYNINTGDMTPKKSGLCDDCNVELIQRSDDNPETYDERYNTYLEKTEPLISYYDTKGIVYHVDSSESPSATHAQVVKILGE